MKLLVIAGLFFLLQQVIDADEVEKVKIDCQANSWYSIQETSAISGFRYVVCKVSETTKILTRHAVVDNKPGYVWNHAPSSLSEFTTTRVSFISETELIHFDVPSEVYSIPKNLKGKFPNLKALRFDGQPIKVIKSADLKQFGDDLETLMVNKGKVEFLEKNLFEYNPKLKFFQLNDNPLKYIEPGFLDNIEAMQKTMQLKTVTLIGLTCIDEADKDLLTLKDKALNCNDRSVMLNTTNITQ